MFLKGIRMDDKKIKAVKQWPEPKSIQVIQVFIRFANFYCWFIQGFNWIAAPLTSILKTSWNTESLTRPKEGVFGFGGGSRAGHDRSELDGDEVDNGEIEFDEVEKKVKKTSKSKNLSKSKKTVGSSDFFTSGAKLMFIKSKQAFFKAPILYHFNLECHIQIETDASGYAIIKILSQLTSDDLGQWYLMVFISRKMILAKTRYKTYDGGLLAIIGAFMT